MKFHNFHHTIASALVRYEFQISISAFRTYFLKNMFFSLLGYCTGDNYKDVRPIDVFCLNTTNYRWTELPKPRVDSLEADDWPFQRYGHTVVAHGQKIYLFGGRNDNHSCNRLYCFDTKTLKWSSPTVFGTIPTAR